MSGRLAATGTSDSGVGRYGALRGPGAAASGSDPPLRPQRTLRLIPPEPAQFRQPAPNVGRNLPHPRGACILKDAQGPCAKGAMMPHALSAAAPKPRTLNPEPWKPRPRDKSALTTARHRATPPEARKSPKIAKRGVSKNEKVGNVGLAGSKTRFRLPRRPPWQEPRPPRRPGRSPDATSGGRGLGP